LPFFQFAARGIGSKLANALGNGISVLISGFMGGFIGQMMYFKNLI